MRNDELAYRIAEHVLETGISRVTEPVLEWAKLRILDVIGCIAIGALAPGSKAALDFVREVGGKPESTVFVLGQKVPAHLAAFVNAICARSFDFEPVGPYVDGISYPAHISGSTIPTALAVAEAVNASGEEMLKALIVGEDVASRLVAASHFNLEEGWDNTGTTNAFGTCAIAGRLFALDKDTLVNAFGIALNQLGGSLQNLYEAVDAFKLNQGLSAQNGIFSVLLAKMGFKGPRKVFEGKHGFFSLYCKTSAPKKLIDKLGEQFYCDDVIKPYPCCRANHAAVDCALEIVKNYGPFKAREIEDVVLHVPFRVSRIFVNRPYGTGKVKQIDAAFNIRYCVARALISGELSAIHFMEPALSDPEVGYLANIIKIVQEDMQKMNVTAHLQITTPRGVCEASCKIPRGDRWYNPLSTDEIYEKFKQNFALLGAEEKSLRIIELIGNLHQVVSVRNFIREISEIITECVKPSL